MKKNFDILRKLGIFRSGFVKGTYTSAKDRPTELMMDNTYNAKKDLINKDDLEQKDKNQKSSLKFNSGFFWIVLIVSVLFLLIMLITSGLSIWLLFSIILWVLFLVKLKKTKFAKIAFWKIIIMFIGISILTLIFFFIAWSSKDLNDNSSSTKENNQTINKMAEFVTAKEVYSELLEKAQKDWSQDAVLIFIHTSTDVDGVEIKDGKSNFWSATFYSPTKKMTCIYNFYGSISKGPEENVDRDVPYLEIKDFIDSPTIFEKSKSISKGDITGLSLVAGDVPHYNFFSNGTKQLKIFWSVIDTYDFKNDSGANVYRFDAATGEKID